MLPANEEALWDRLEQLDDALARYGHLMSDRERREKEEEFTTTWTSLESLGVSTYLLHSRLKGDEVYDRPF